MIDRETSVELVSFLFIIGLFPLLFYTSSIDEGEFLWLNSYVSVKIGPN